MDEEEDSLDLTLNNALALRALWVVAAGEEAASEDGSRPKP